MATISNIYVIAAVAICFSYLSTTKAEEGTATFYTSYVPSACYGNKNKGNMIAAASDPLWNNGKICGTKYKVKCTGPTNGVRHPCTGASVEVKVVDHCPRCGGTLDLSRQAFAAIANPVAGVIKISYTKIA